MNNNLSYEVSVKSASHIHFMMIMKSVIVIIFSCCFILLAQAGFTQNTIDVNLNNAQQQRKNISGVITDSEGEFLPGVTVIVKGTSKGTISDINGYLHL